jgi:hypothetical protein
MTKQELFEKYSIDESHNTWDNGIDNWMSVEVYRITHDGNLPPSDDSSTKWVLDFLDEVHSNPAKHFGRKNFGSLYLTSKRMVYTLSDQILEEINN